MTQETEDVVAERFAGHTPGPWADNLHAGEKRDGGRYYVHVFAKAAGIVPVACVPTGVEGYGRDEGRANARLIAAAPRLLAENKALSDRIDVLEARAVELVMAGNAWPQHTITADEAAFEARQVCAAPHQEGIDG